MRCLRHVLIAAFLCLMTFASGQSRAALFEPFNSDPVLSPIQAPGAWYTDRYAPAGFQRVVFDGDNRLQVSISAADCQSCRPSGYTSAFYNTQGRKYDLPAATTVMSIQLYVPADWATTGRRMAGFWGTGFDAGNVVSLFPIIEFTSGPDGSGLPRFRGWDNGVWVDMGLPTGFLYNRWYTLSVQLIGPNVLYTVGDLSALVPAFGTTYFGNTILQGHNTDTPGVTYDIHWDNLSTGSTAAITLNAAPCSTTGQVTVNIDMTGATEPVVGGQFFMSYDTSRLSFVSAVPGSAPFTVQVFENVNTMAGTIDYFVGIPPGPGTSADTTMAVLTFNWIGADSCDTGANLVQFRTHTPITRLTNSTADPIVPTLTPLGTIAVDSTDPVITCPPDVNVNADAGICTAASASLFGPGWAIGGNAAIVTDPTHGLAVNLSSQFPPGTFSFLSNTLQSPLLFSNLLTLSCDYNMQSGCFGGGAPRFSLRIDYDNNGVDSAGDHSIFVYFGTPPGFTDCPPLNTWLNTGNMIATSDLRFDTSQFPGGNFYSTHAQAVALLGAFNLLRISIAVDGQFSPGTQSVLIDNITINASTQTFNSATATDNCTASPTISAVRGDLLPLTDPYPTGTTLVTWTATDACGNTSSCIQQVTVNAFNTLTATVRLANVSPGTYTRCISFGLPTAGCTTFVNETMTFVNGLATASFDIPCGSYSCITARDPLHTLRRTADAGHFGISGTNYVANFTGTDELLGGNLNDDEVIDILDFGGFIGQFGLVIGASTTCSTSPIHADFSGNGVVFVEDFSFIQTQLLVFREIDCCGNQSNQPGDPVIDISTDDLVERNMPELVVADLNHDGRLNPDDVASFLSGARPTCSADWNGDGAVSSQDFFYFLGTFFEGRGDFNRDGSTTSQDFFSFLTAFFRGC